MTRSFCGNKECACLDCKQAQLQATRTETTQTLGGVVRDGYRFECRVCGQETYVYVPRQDTGLASNTVLYRCYLAERSTTRFTASALRSGKLVNRNDESEW